MSPTPTDKSQRFLQLIGNHLTREQVTVVEAVLAIESPFDAEQVITRIAKHSSARRIRRSAIYRILSALEASGCLCEVERRDHDTSTDGLSGVKLLEWTHKSFASLCRETHAQLVTGTCPWCGRAILQGRAKDELDT
jgi:Fe2+ or Zn2+ uptake regulation protein